MICCGHNKNYVLNLDKPQLFIKRQILYCSDSEICVLDCKKR